MEKKLFVKGAPLLQRVPHFQVHVGVKKHYIIFLLLKKRQKGFFWGKNINHLTEKLQEFSSENVLHQNIKKRRTIVCTSMSRLAEFEILLLTLSSQVFRLNDNLSKNSQKSSHKARKAVKMCTKRTFFKSLFLLKIYETRCFLLPSQHNSLFLKFIGLFKRYLDASKP